MTTTATDELDRTTSGRFVRNLALSLSGGALLTLLGAGVAQADDGAAGTASDGAGTAGTGDANAVGNQAGTNSTQTVTVSGNLGVIQVINQNANVVNGGVGIANTGGNIAIGNASSNNATAGQTANGGASGGAANNGEAANNSNGSALIQTGNASAVGNNSTTNLVQEAHGSAQGTLGGILVINQDANVINAGLGVATTGGNAAIGNASGRVFGANDAGVLQNSQSDGSLANNNGSATNDSNGKAVVNTGNASATGNKSDTHIIQRASGSAGGAMGGLMIIDQDANVVNAGVAVANTGGNVALGNVSTSTSEVGDPPAPAQNAVLTGAGGDIGVASNNGEAANWSDGTALISTGDAGAVGNDSRTRVTQSANGAITGGGGFFGGSVVTQDSNVLNAGAAFASSGINGALGNGSSNGAGVVQAAAGAGFDDVGVVGNFGKAANTSDGTGSVHSGGAYAAGNRSQTDVSQTAEVEGGAFNLQTQGNAVANLGVGVANSGVNGGVGNISRNTASVNQGADLVDNGPAGGVGVGVIGQFGLASNDSDGTGVITTGDATAVGNDSATALSQEIDPNGIAVQTQVAGVANVGFGVANSGGNFALGNFSTNTTPSGLGQDAGIAPATGIDADTLVIANNGEASNASDGTATIHTGTAAATGNRSRTVLGQESNAAIGGLGAVINTQVAGVANVGVGVANSGINAAVGNISQNEAEGAQTADIGGAGSVTAAGPVILNNSGAATNASDGNAAIWTGNATGVGNQSNTELTQSAEGDVDGLGVVVNTQVGGVLNAGIGLGTSGGNLAVANASANDASLSQTNNLSSPGAVNVVGPLTLSNSGEASNASDGTAGIVTGSAQGTGNRSETRFRQEATGSVDGLGAVTNTQIGGVANLGLGVGNSGVNAAVGNVSDNDAGNGLPLDPGLAQNIQVNPDDLDVLGPLTLSNAGEASNSSDGTGVIHTGAAHGRGNVSATAFGQHADGTVGEDGLGVVPNLQVGAVVNAGAGFANSGVNLAVGNAAGRFPGRENSAEADQVAAITDLDIDVVGPVTVANNGRATNSSGGTGKVHTGGALATGNESATNFSQAVHADVDGLGLVIAPQVGLVANIGVGVANSGVNAAVGNLSTNTALLGPAGGQSAFLSSPDLTIFGPVTVGNNGEASNTSDGFACTCTGEAVASGNVSTTNLNQFIDIGVDDGIAVVPTTGIILNAGFGLANSGVNLAIGNISDNTATTDQLAELDADPGFLFGPQSVVNGGAATNASNGTGKVGTGRANATGNLSTSDLTQVAAVDGTVFATINGNIGNIGAGVANSGINAGIGNASTNVADLDQTARGTGTVANNGEAANASDGFGGVGDPNCEDKPVTPPPGEEPPPDTTPRLPKTGGFLEVEAAVGLLLLLAGFGFRRAGKRLGVVQS